MFSIFDFLNIYSVLGCAFLLCWFYSRSAYNYWRKLKVKYLEPVPFLGHTAPTLFHLISFHEQYDKFYKALYDEPFGGIYEILQPQLIVKDPELVSAILTKDFKHFYDHGFEQMVSKDKNVDPLNANLFFADGERWKVLRQQMSPVFTSGKLKLMHDQILNCVHLLTENIDNLMSGRGTTDVGLKMLFEKLTIDIIGSCAFGIDCNSLKSNEKFTEMGRETVKLRLMVTLRMIIAIFSTRLANWLKITIMRKEVNDFFLHLALDTMDYRRQRGVNRNDLLQLLMELQNSHVDPKFAVGDKDKKILITGKLLCTYLKIRGRYVYNWRSGLVFSLFKCKIKEFKKKIEKKSFVGYGK